MILLSWKTDLSLVHALEGLLKVLFNPYFW